MNLTCEHCESNMTWDQLKYTDHGGDGYEGHCSNGHYNFYNVHILDALAD